jgi:acyl-CoA thioesterase-1
LCVCLGEGADYTTQFRAIFSDLASKKNVAFIPFIIKDVGGIMEWNQNDWIHPTLEGHRIVLLRMFGMCFMR